MRRVFIIVLLICIASGALWYFKFRTQTNTTGQTQTGFKSFFPIGGVNKDNSSDNQIPSPEREDTTTPIGTSSLFKQLTSQPIAGFTSFTQTKTVSTPGATPKAKPTIQTITDSIIRYVSRQSGFVYEIKNDSAPLQISNIFIPSIYQAFFADSNQTALLQFLRDDGQTVGTYAVPIPPENTDGTRTQKEGIFLPDGIRGIAVSPDTKEFVRLTTEKTQGVITTTNTLDKNKKEVLRSPLKEWSVFWPKATTLYLQTKPAGIVEGFLYSTDRVNGVLKRIVGNVKGLTASISPSGTLVLYSESTKDGFITKLLHTNTGNIQSVGLSILPEKCSWLKNEDLICAGATSVAPATYPDAWYAGIVSFSDNLFRIYTKTNTFDVLSTETEQSFDMVSLQVDETKNTLFFIDKKTGFLWKFSL